MYFNPIHTTMSVHYLRVLNFTQNFLKMPAFLSQLTSVFFLYVSETWNGSFLCTIDGVHSIYITSVIFPRMVGLAAPTDAQSKVAVFILVYNLLPHPPFLCLLQKTYCLFHLCFFSVDGILLGKCPLDDVATITLT